LNNIKKLPEENNDEYVSMNTFENEEDDDFYEALNQAAEEQDIFDTDKYYDSENPDLSQLR
jgi:hypothetical protein